MKLNLYEDENIQDEHVDVYYSNMRPVIKQIIDTVNSERPVLSGKPADEDLDDGEEIILDPKEIYYLDHIDRKLFAYTENGVYRLMSTLATCEDMLWNYGFVRVSKSNLINIYKIRQLKPDVNMKVYASFDNGERICINRSYKKSFNEYLQKMRRMSR
jgi:DNA-binding LytR/AlgR family response regulator